MEGKVGQLGKGVIAPGGGAGLDPGQGSDAADWGVG